MGDFKEWLSDNLRYFLVGVVVILIIGGSILGLKIYSSKVNGNSDPAVIRKNTEAQTETGKETETKKQTEKETKKQTVQHLPMQVQTVKEVQQITAKMAAIPQTMLHRTVAAHTVMAHRAATVHMIMQAMMQRPMAVTTAMTRRM